VVNLYSGLGVKLHDSYVFGANSIMNGEMIGGIFRMGQITNSAIMSNSTEIVEFKKI
jgi:hypothetical protein